MGNYNGSEGLSGFSAMPELKYYDKYTSTTSTQACKGGVCYGHALSETSGWYGTLSRFVDSSSHWLYRGGGYSYGSSAGVFYFDSGHGNVQSGSGFRIVLVSS